MGAMKLGLVLAVTLVVAMTTACVATDACKGNPAEGNPLREELGASQGACEGASEGASQDVDHTDIFNFDPVSQTMGQSRLEGCQRELLQCRQNLANLHEKTLISAMYDKSEDHDVMKTCKKELKTCRDDLKDCELGYQVNVSVPAEDDSSTESPCKLEQMFFRRYAKHFIRLLIGEEDRGGDGSPLGAEVRLELTSYNWLKLRQFVQQKGKVRLIDAHDLLTDMLVSVRHDNGTGPASWLERLTGMETTDIKFYGLLCLLSIVVVVFESKTHASWWQQFCAVMFILFMISVVWNWILLYRKEFASKMSKMLRVGEEMPVSCRPEKMTWWDSLKEAIRQQISFQDSPCELYHRDILVDPIFEVPPTRAITYTLSSMFLEPLGHLGKHLAEFYRDLLRDLPYAAWLPALLSVLLLLLAVVLTIVIVLLYCPRPRAPRGDRDRDREDAAVAWARVRMLEAELRGRDALGHGHRQLEELEVLRKGGYRAAHQAPALDPYPGRDIDQGGPEQPRLATSQRPAYPAEATAAERPRASGRRRVRGSSDSDLLQHQQQHPYRQHQQRQPLPHHHQHGDQGRPYQGDVSDESSSDEAGVQIRPRPTATLPLENLPGSGGARVPLPRPGGPAARDTPRLKTTEILKQPVESPYSEIESERDHPFKPGPARGQAGGSGQGVRPSLTGPPGRGASGRRKPPQLASGPEEPAEEDEAKVRRVEGQRPAELGPALTPASSTDSDPFPAAAAAATTAAAGCCDSPSSVSVIEGDSSPASAGSVDGDSHLRGLGTSLSGSIDIIEPFAPSDNPRLAGEEGQDSDEFEVLSREQCQSEDIGP